MTQVVSTPWEAELRDEGGGLFTVIVTRRVLSNGEWKREEQVGRSAGETYMTNRFEDVPHAVGKIHSFRLAAILMAHFGVYI